jgi:5-methylcytosine-specific restriction endonuclease McrA
MKTKFANTYERYRIVNRLNGRHTCRALAAQVEVVDATTHQLIRIFAKQKRRCCYCNCLVERLTLEHIKPISKGGNHTAKNIAFACVTCNKRKADLDPFDFKKNGVSAMFLLNFGK